VRCCSIRLYGLSDVGALLGVTLQIPARDVSCAGEQSVDAGLHFWRIEEEFRLAILLRHGVIAGNRDLAEGLAIRGDAVAEESVVNGVGEQGQAQRGRECNHDDSLQEMFDAGSQGCAHGVNYTRTPRGFWTPMARYEFRQISPGSVLNPR
jgi:hypothetical protein